MQSLLRFRLLAAAVFVVVLSGFCFAQPQVTKVEPPNWWTNYVSPVMVLLYGNGLSGADISVNYPGVSVQKVQAQSDGKHAFVWLDIAHNAAPGKVTLAIHGASGDATAELTLLARQPQQGKFQGVTRDDVIYLIMPDRFADGDSTNNMPPGSAPGTYDRSAPKTYHGGDLKGVTDHLSYLKDLGVTTLWLTPVYDQDNATSDYHGYGAVDLYQVEDHFGTMADYQNFVAEAHKLGLKVLFDTVPNHVGPNHPWATSQPAPGWLHGTTERHINTDYNYPPITDPHAVEGNYISALDGWFADKLPDLAQENPLVAQYLLQNALWWTESSGIDGLRIDTFPYVPRIFWAYFLKGILDVYPNFFAVGEIFNVEPTVTSYWAGGNKGFDGVDTLLKTPFDFPMQNAINKVLNEGQSATLILNVLRQDRLFRHPELLVTFIGNHDMPRFITQASGSPEKLKAAFALIATQRGIPQLYYGDEIGMPGANDPDDRHDFPGGFPGDQHNAFVQVGRTPEQQEIFSYLQSLLKFRHDHPALREGVQKHVAFADDYYLFTREVPGERLLVAFYKGTSPTTLSLDLANTSIADARQLTALFAGSTATLNDGKINLQLQPVSVAVYKVE
jgi:glycosidase